MKNKNRELLQFDETRTRKNKKKQDVLQYKY